MQEQDLSTERTDFGLPAHNDRELNALLCLARAPDADLTKISTSLVDRILKGQFGFDDFFLFEREREKLIGKLALLLEKLPGRNLKNKVIIDLGCGYIGGRDKTPEAKETTETEDPAEKDCRNHPWFCRILYILGARPIGIDIGNMEGEEFQHHRLDLLEDNALRDFPAESADAVIADELFHSARLIEMKIKNRKLPIKNLRRKLFPQIQGILKTKGFYLEEDAAVWGKYQTIGKYDICHEGQSKLEVMRLLEIHRSTPEYHSHEIARKIGRLLLPYMLEEYEFNPDDEIADIIEFQCEAVLDLLTKNFPEKNPQHQMIIELDPRDIIGTEVKDERIHEPWSSRFIGMLGINSLLIGFDRNGNSEHRDIYKMAGYPIDMNAAQGFADAIISPALQKLPKEGEKETPEQKEAREKLTKALLEEKEFYLSKIRQYLKPNGFYIERDPDMVKISKS